MLSILNELKRRNVFRVARAYTVVSWILVQVAVAVFPVFDAPHWALKVLLLFMALGFPLVLLLAWAYELTPEGLRRTPEATHVEDRNSRYFDSALVVVLILALIVTTIGAHPWSSATIPAGEGPPGDGDAQAAQTVVAVMPFASLSSDTAAAALATGLSDSIQNVLSVTYGLATAGMASTLIASDAKQDYVEISETMSVDYLVEGSVRQNDGEIHIFAQLVELPEGDAVWSARFEYSKAGLEPVRDEIAASIADELAGPVAAATEPTGLSATAFEDWLRLLGQLCRGGTDNVSNALVLADSLVERAPAFGPAHAARAYILAAQTTTSSDVDFNNRVAEINGLLDEAMALAPSSPRVRLWRARATSLVTRWAGSEAALERVNRLFEEVLRVSPPSGDLYAAYAEHKLAWSATQDALALSQRALELDPLSLLPNRIRILALIRSGKRDLAEAEIDELPGPRREADRLRAALAVARGELRDALDAYQKIPESEEGILHLEAVRLWVTIGEAERAMQVIEAQEPTLERDIWRLALDHRYTDAYELARDQLSPDHPETALLIGVLAIEADEYEAAVEVFSRHVQGWIEDAGPLRGPAAIRYAPWFAKALMQVDRDAEARRLLDRHLAGLIVIEANLSPAESGVYFAANYAARGRTADAELALDRAVDDGFRLTLGALGGPVDITQSTLMSSLDLDASRIRRGEEL
ncbi:MAG TPA: hypothetical protein VK854_01770 [Woeseiaceae bacterium]|nr:hypothetical protein [Woeseiaceae bacterium]